MNTQPKRTYYLDNLRIYLTVLVILHHAASLMAEREAGPFTML